MDVVLTLCGVAVVILAIVCIFAIRECVAVDYSKKRYASECEDYRGLLRKAEREIESLRRTINTRDEQITAYERRLDSIGVIAQTKRNEEWQQEMEFDIESIIKAAKNLEERWETES